MSYLRHSICLLLICLLAACQREQVTDFEDGSPLAESIEGSGEAIIPGLDGGFVMMARRDESPGSNATMVIKLTEQGEPEWTFTESGSTSQYAAAVIHRQSGGYLVMSDLFDEADDFSPTIQLTELSLSGAVTRAMRLDSLKGYGAESLVETADGGLMIVGRVTAEPDNFSCADEQLFLMKLDAQLQVEWVELACNENGLVGVEVRQTFDGGYLVLSRARSSAMLCRFDQDGNELWSHDLDRGAWPSDMLLLPDGTAVLAMENYQAESLSDPMVMLVDAQGATLWNKTYALPHKQRLNAIVADGSGGYYLAGGSTRRDHSHATEDAMLWHIAHDGELIGEEQISPRMDQQYFNAMTILPNGRMALVGTTWGWCGDERTQVFLSIR